MSSEPSGVATPSSRCRRSASHAPPVRMPTSPVESLIPARSLPASSRHSASASGSVIEVALEDDLSRERVHVALVLAPALPGLAQRFARRGGAEPFIGEVHGEAKARFELAREPPRAPRHLVLAAVHRERQAHEQPAGTPFAQQRLDLGEAPGRVLGLEHADGTRDARLGVADGDTDPAGTEIKSEDGVARDLRRSHGRLIHACPASSESFAKSTPSSFIAAGRRSSAGVSKMIASRASTVSQAFCLISFSSWPAAQPE